MPITNSSTHLKARDDVGTFRRRCYARAPCQRLWDGLGKRSATGRIFVLKFNLLPGRSQLPSRDNVSQFLYKVSFSNVIKVV